MSRSFANGNGASNANGSGMHGNGAMTPRAEHWWTLVNGVPPR